LLLQTLTDLLASEDPMYWFSLCQSVLTSAGSATKAEEAAKRQLEQEHDEEVRREAEAAKAAKNQQSDDDDEDRDDDEGSGAQSLTGGAEAEAADRNRFRPRYLTKVMAVRLLDRVLCVVQQIRPHVDLEAARERPDTARMLVTHLGAMISLACKAVNARAPPLRVAGMRLLQRILQVFGETRDPDALPGEIDGDGGAGAERLPLLLEQYQVQVSSALKSAFANGSPPGLTAAACSALVTYTRVLRQRASAVRRVLTLLERPLHQLRSLRFEAFGKQAAATVQLALLHAAAELLSGDHTAAAVTPWLRPFLPALRAHWMAALRDYAVISTQPEEVRRVYAGCFYSFAAATHQQSLAEFQLYWSAWLVASSMLVGDRQVWLCGRGVAPPPEHREEEEAADLGGVATPPSGDGDGGAPPPHRSAQEKRDALAALLRESTPLADAQLLLGLALGYLSGPYRGTEAVASLHALRLLLVGCQRQQEIAAGSQQQTESTHTTTTAQKEEHFFPPQLCGQLLAVTGLLLEHGRDQVPVAAAELVQQVATFLSAKYLESAGELGELVVVECVDQCAMVLAGFERQSVGAAAELGSRAAAIATALGELGGSLPQRLRARFLPPLLGLCCRVLRAHHASALVQHAALLSLHQLLPACELEARAAAVTLLCGDTEEEGGVAGERTRPAHREVVVRALFLVAPQLPTDQAVAAVAHGHCCAYLGGVLREASGVLRGAQLIVLQTLTAWLQADAHTELALLYAQALGPAVVLLCRQFSDAHGACGEELARDEVARALLDQCVRFLVLAHARTNQSLLGLLLPVFITLLDATQAHHQTVLQIVLSLVQQSGAQAKAVLDQLPAEERARLEEAVRQKVQQEQEAQRAAELAAQQRTERRRMPGEIDFDAF
jgi:Laa1/Sip1/HEATR5 HEAT repeat region